MLIVLEGIDCSGKTTLIEAMSAGQADETKVLHSGPLAIHPLDAYVRPLLAMYKDPLHNNVVCDRWHIGELIYGPLYRGHSRLTPAMNRYVELFLTARGALKLWMNTSFTTVEIRIKRRGENFLQEHHQRLVHDFYIEHCHSERWTGVPERWDSTHIDHYTNQAMSLAEEAEHLQHMAPTYVGTLKPDVIFVGDHQHRILSPTASPALMTYESLGGHHLLSVTESVGLRNIGLVSVDGTKFRALYEALDQPKVVALGSVNADAILNAGVPCALVLREASVLSRSPYSLQRQGLSLRARLGID